MATPEDKILNLDIHHNITRKSIGMNIPITVLSLASLIAGFFFLNEFVSLNHAILFLVTGLMGVALYHAHFGFTSSFRRLLISRRSIGIRAQMLMFMLTNLLFLPVFLNTSVLGHAVKANVHPVGLSVLAGSILFGIGMQLGDGCASGTLYHTGGGDYRGILTIIGFVIGSLIGTAHFAWWMTTPQLGPVSFIQSFGAVGGLLFNFLLLLIVFLFVHFLEKKRYGKVEPLFGKGKVNFKTMIKGPWSWVAGGLVLAIGNFVLLVLSGKPWGVTSAFALWGAKIAQGFGVHVENWSYWQSGSHAQSLQEGVLHHLETTDNIAIMVGALLAAALGGMLPKRFFHRIPWKMTFGIIFGGILMGYGARIAFGCNIGGYFSAISSFSLHGWEWFLGGLIGSAIGLVLRPVCKLKN